MLQGSVVQFFKPTFRLHNWQDFNMKLLIKASLKVLHSANYHSKLTTTAVESELYCSSLWLSTELCVRHTNVIWIFIQPSSLFNNHSYSNRIYRSEIFCDHISMCTVVLSSRSSDVSSITKVNSVCLSDSLTQQKWFLFALCNHIYFK